MSDNFRKIADHLEAAVRRTTEEQADKVIELAFERLRPIVSRLIAEEINFHLFRRVRLEINGALEAAYEDYVKAASSATAAAAQAPRRSGHTADSTDPLTVSSPTARDTPDRS